MIEMINISGEPFASPVSDGTIVGNMIYTTQIPRDFVTDELQGTDIEAQTRATLQNLAITLERAGSDFAHIAHITIYLVDPDHAKGMNAVYREFFKSHFPNRATVVVKRLVDPDMLVEMVVVAVKAS